MSKSTSAFDYLNSLDRYKFLTILNAADECEEYQFVKQACMLWLVNYSGDLFVQYLQALNYNNLGKHDQALAMLEKLVEFDPQFVEATQALAELTQDATRKTGYLAIAQYLTEETPASDRPEDWLTPLWKARQAYSAGDLDQTTQLIHESLIKEPNSPLPAILHLKAVYLMKNGEMLNNLSEIYHQKWPNCLQIKIIKSLAEMEKGEESDPVERLHWVAAHDSAGQVIQRLLGYRHRFQNMWPDKLEITFDLPVPASVSTLLGWNQLQQGTVVDPEISGFEDEDAKQPESPFEKSIPVPEAAPPFKSSAPAEAHKRLEDPEAILESINPMFARERWATDEDFEDIQMVFSRLAKRYKQPDIERSDNRFPVYVVLSSKQQLEAQYGPNTAAIIDGLIQDLVTQIGKLPEWGTRVFYPDDPALMSQLGLKPDLANDAWKVKLSLADLDKALEKQGEMIGALLIVGGPEIVPFHHLPNPTYDDDLDVPSDNPYGTVDENYFIPQWPVGRLPGESGSDAGLLLYQIRQLIYQYEKQTKKSFNPVESLNRLFAWLRRLFSNINLPLESKKSLGYSAEVWKEASAGVYTHLGKVKDLTLSPPTDSGNIVLANGQQQDLGYFNLHGIKDGPHWYGQKGFTSESTGPDYPIALSPGLFSEKVPSPKFVVSEACYGANVQNKQNDEAISLKFLGTGTGTFVGSTCIAYGSVTPPLIAADYLAELYWKQVLQGDPVGYALMRAKLTLAQEMTRLQGFLDGEDQKTLLSFVLYGDPLAIYDGTQSSPKPLFRAKKHPLLKTLSDSDLQPALESHQIPDKMTASFKQAVEKYLPGLHNARMKVSPSMAAQANGKSKTSEGDRYYVTLEKSVDENHHTTHKHYARMTFDKKGKLVKLSTSR